jgi:hypothetical protein
MHSQVATFVFAMVFGGETSAAHAQLLPRRDLSYSIAKTIAETAIENCTAGGYRVSAVVVDRDGETIVALRGDNASPHAIKNARRKAYTALSFRTSTTAYAKRLADGDPVVHEQVHCRTSSPSQAGFRSRPAMILSAALASPARLASMNPASRRAWTRSPINSIEVRRGGCSSQTASQTHLWGKTQRFRFLDHICTIERVR